MNHTPKIFRLVFSLFLIAVTGASPVDATEYKKEITLGSEDAWAPYSNPDGTGMANDIITAAYKAVGIKVNYVVKPYNRLLKETEDGKILGAFNIPDDAVRVAQFLFHKIKLYDAVSYYYYNVDAPLKEHTKEDFKDGEVTIGLIPDYGYGREFAAIREAEKFTAAYTRSDEQNINKLLKKRIDTALVFDKTAHILFKEMNLYGKIEKGFENERAAIFVGFSKALPESQYYADLLDEGLKIIQENGQYDKIMRSY